MGGVRGNARGGGARDGKSEGIPQRKSGSGLRGDGSRSLAIRTDHAGADARVIFKVVMYWRCPRLRRMFLRRRNFWMMIFLSRNWRTIRADDGGPGHGRGCRWWVPPSPAMSSTLLEGQRVAVLADLAVDGDEVALRDPVLVRAVLEDCVHVCCHPRSVARPPPSGLGEDVGTQLKSTPAAGVGIASRRFIPGDQAKRAILTHRGSGAKPFAPSRPRGGVSE